MGGAKKKVPGLKSPSGYTPIVFRVLLLYVGRVFIILYIGRTLVILTMLKVKITRLCIDVCDTTLTLQI